MNTAFAFCVGLALSAVAPPRHQAGQVAALNADAKLSTMEALIKNMNERYVSLETAKKIEASLRSWMSSSEYTNLDDPKAFSSKVNEILKKEVTDAHLRFRYSEQVLPARERPAEPSAAELKRYAEQTRFVNAGFDRVERLPGNIGLVAFRGFWSPQDMARPLEGAMTFLSNVDAMIVDLRQNGGGDPAGVQLFCSYFFDGKPVHLNDIQTRQGDKVTTAEFWTLKKVAGPRFAKVPLYVLTSKRTGSGAEECAYDFQQLHRGLIIGESTWGGANPGDVVRLNDHFSCFIPVGRACNPYTKTNWEGTGVVPDIKSPAADSLKTAHEMALKKLIEDSQDGDRKAALQEALNDLESKKG